MAQRLPRFNTNLQREDAEKVDRLVAEAQLADLPARAGATAGGDRRRARGVPIVGRGIVGTAPRTAPLGELVRKESGRL